MSAVRAHFLVQFYGTLPDDDGLEADDAFERMGEEILAVLNRADLSGVGIANESFSIVDGDTEPDE